MKKDVKNTIKYVVGLKLGNIRIIEDHPAEGRIN